VEPGRERMEPTRASRSYTVEPSRPVLIVESNILPIVCATKLQLDANPVYGQSDNMGQVHRLIVQKGIEEAKETGSHEA
jgi:hypothetical protein